MKEASLKNNPKLQGHALRAAINTPIQGSAADIVMMAMLKIYRNDKLKQLGQLHAISIMYLASGILY